MNKGRVVNFEESAVIDETNVVSLSSGSLEEKEEDWPLLTH